MSDTNDIFYDNYFPEYDEINLNLDELIKNV